MFLISLYIFIFITVIIFSFIKRFEDIFLFESSCCPRLRPRLPKNVQLLFENDINLSYFQ